MSGGEGITVDVILPMEKAGSERVRRAAVARKLGISPSRIKDVRLVKESIDSRQKKILFQLRLLVGVDSPLPPERLPSRDYPSVRPGSLVALIVGFGPAGMFAALRCLELGMKPVVLERGKDVSSRRFDLAPILRRGTVMEDSNYCFGEGGAGTFSDGKLFTRATKRGPVREVYEIFVAHGAPREILTDAHPHIGSNLLPNVVKAIRESILRAGGNSFQCPCGASAPFCGRPPHTRRGLRGWPGICGGFRFAGYRAQCPGRVPHDAGGGAGSGTEILCRGCAH